MSDRTANLDRMLELAGAVCDEAATQDDLVLLDSMVVADESLRREYWDYCRVHVTFGMESRVHCGLRNVREREGDESSMLAPWESDALAGTVLPLAIPASATPAFPAGLQHGTVTYFSSGWPLAYLIATVIVTTGLLVAAITHISQPEQLVAASPVSAPPTKEPSAASAGMVTGVADCRWMKGSTPLLLNDTVPVGREIKLESGLVELTCDTGAKVILQGPVTYNVESATGGYLKVGKLTACVEHAKTEDPRPKTQGPNPKSPNLQVLRSYSHIAGHRLGHRVRR
jgi:hypothetical protein